MALYGTKVGYTPNVSPQAQEDSPLDEAINILGLGQKIVGARNTSIETSLLKDETFDETFKWISKDETSPLFGIPQDFDMFDRRPTVDTGNFLTQYLEDQFQPKSQRFQISKEGFDFINSGTPEGEALRAKYTEWLTSRNYSESQISQILTRGTHDSKRIPNNLKQLFSNKVNQSSKGGKQVSNNVKKMVTKSGFASKPKGNATRFQFKPHGGVSKVEEGWNFNIYDKRGISGPNLMQEVKNISGVDLSNKVDSKWFDIDRQKEIWNNISNDAQYQNLLDINPEAAKEYAKSIFQEHGDWGEMVFESSSMIRDRLANPVGLKTPSNQPMDFNNINFGMPDKGLELYDTPQFEGQKPRLQFNEGGEVKEYFSWTNPETVDKVTQDNVFQGLAETGEKVKNFTGKILKSGKYGDFTMDADHLHTLGGMYENTEYADDVSAFVTDSIQKIGKGGETTFRTFTEKFGEQLGEKGTEIAEVAFKESGDLLSSAGKLAKIGGDVAKGIGDITGVIGIGTGAEKAFGKKLDSMSGKQYVAEAVG